MGATGVKRVTAAWPVLQVRGLRVSYHTDQGVLRVVDGVDLDVLRGEIFGIAGESGCGKSTVVEAILRLVRPPGRIEEGEILLRPTPGDRRSDGRASLPPDQDGAAEPGVATGGGIATGAAIDLLRLPTEAMRRMRWRALAYVPQGSMNALNPVLRVREQMLDCMLDHDAGSLASCEARLPELLRGVGLSPDVLSAFAHQLSGGMRQRVIIAASIALDPEIVIADEPTTALDVHAQRLILQTMRRIRARAGVTMVFVSHDLAVHAELVDRLGVMYAGQVVEVAPIAEVFHDPLHPYTRGLVQSLPQIGGRRRRLRGIPGLAPSPLHWPQGCRFHPRCPYAFARCRERMPTLRPTGDGRQVACHLYEPEEAARLADARAAAAEGGAEGARLQVDADAEAGGVVRGR
jgi:peptide/nickel transport system ATP-binding protein